MWGDLLKGVVNTVTLGLAQPFFNEHEDRVDKARRVRIAENMYLRSDIDKKEYLRRINRSEW